MLGPENADWEVTCTLTTGETCYINSYIRGPEKLKLSPEGSTVPLRKVREGKNH